MGKRCVLPWTVSTNVVSILKRESQKVWGSLGEAAAYLSEELGIDLRADRLKKIVDDGIEGKCLDRYDFKVAVVNRTDALRVRSGDRAVALACLVQWMVKEMGLELPPYQQSLLTALLDRNRLPPVGEKSCQS
jgi:hypothetical protein